MGMWDPLRALSPTDITGCYTGDKNNFGTAACQNACMFLMSNVFRNDDIGHPLQPIDDKLLDSILDTLGGTAIREFMSILNYNFSKAHDKPAEEQKPEPTPS